MQLQRHQWAVTVYNIKHTYCVRILLVFFRVLFVRDKIWDPLKFLCWPPPPPIRYTEQGSRVLKQLMVVSSRYVHWFQFIQGENEMYQGKKRSRERVDQSQDSRAFPFKLPDISTSLFNRGERTYKKSGSHLTFCSISSSSRYSNQTCFVLNIKDNQNHQETYFSLRITDYTARADLIHSPLFFFFKNIKKNKSKPQLAAPVVHGAVLN